MKKKRTLAALWGVATLMGVTAFGEAAEDVYAPIVDPARALGLYTYDVDDYVQDGLVALYDGIRNVGRTLPHDSAAAKWTDLAAPSRTASIKVCGQRHAHRREVTR